MKDIEKILVSPVTTIRKTLEIIDHSSRQIALVVDQYNRLLGTVTDGDIRRGILVGVPLDANIERIMNCSPVVANVTDDREKILARMKATRLHQIPVIDEQRHIVGLEIVDDLIQTQSRENWVIIMAGGLGNRLKPLTHDKPKPLIKIGEKPILEIILENFVRFGFKKFFISVHYKAEMIKEHFGDGSRWNTEIQYIEENVKLGTAGSLGLLPERPESPVLVMNGDLLTKVNFQLLLDFHQDHQSKATMCVREYSIQVPFGVVRLDRHRLTAIDEKPVQKFFVNAGIYVLEPEVLAQIDSGVYLDMPALFEKIIGQGLETTVFPIREYWLDIGRHDDLERANQDYLDNCY